MNSMSLIGFREVARRLGAADYIVDLTMDYIPHIILPPSRQRAGRRYYGEYINLFLSTYQHQPLEYRPPLVTLLEWFRGHPNAKPYIFGFRDAFTKYIMEFTREQWFSERELAQALNIPNDTAVEWLYDQPLAGVVDSQSGRFIAARSILEACTVHLP